METKTELFTVNVYQVSRDEPKDLNLNGGSLEQKLPMNASRKISDYPNMTSAKVIKGKMVELEHCKLAGDAVKFKTIVNYNKILKPEESLGVALIPQDSYLMKPDHDETDE